jgi:hypothetical protein
MDMFVDAVGRVWRPGKRARYWAVYKEMIPVLIEHERSGLNGTIGDLQALAPETRDRPA